MSGAMIETRVEEVISAELTQVAGGSLTVGPFARDAVIQRVGMLVINPLDIGDVTVTFDNAGVSESDFVVPSGAAANSVHVHEVYDLAEVNIGVDAEGVSTSPSRYVLPKGTTVAVSAAAVATATGDYRLFAEIIKLPLSKGGDGVFVV